MPQSKEELARILLTRDLGMPMECLIPGLDNLWVPAIPAWDLTNIHLAQASGYIFRIKPNG